MRALGAVVSLLFLLACERPSAENCAKTCPACCTTTGACVPSCGVKGPQCGNGVAWCENGQNHFYDEHDCIGVPSPWECGSPGTYCGDRGPCPDAGVCTNFRCTWPADGGP